MDLADGQWEVLGSLIPEPSPRADGWGRPWRDPRDVLSGILFGFCALEALGRDLPERYPPHQTPDT